MTFYDLCRSSFLYFFFFGFSRAIRAVEGKFITPYHHKSTCIRLETFKKTATIDPRFHLKSTVVEAYVLWKMLRDEYVFNEWEYFSYTGDLASYHTKRIKRYLLFLPDLYKGYENLSDSESIVSYRSPRGNIFYCEPSGVLTFKRGKHPHGIICDDILRDPQAKLDFSVLEKISRIFFEEIESMPKEELHIVGTPQDTEDLFSQLESRGKYNVVRRDAIIDESKQKTLWSLAFDWNELQSRKQSIGEKAFNKEFRCRPVRGEEGFVSLQKYGAMVEKRLRNYDILNPPKIRGNRMVVGGFDIGKKTHPSHLSVFGVSGNRMIQLCSKFMDGWDYNDQIVYLKMAIEKFNIAKLFYDDTRAEFEQARERGELPGEMEGVAFTAGTKFAMASDLDQTITTEGILLLEDPRQKRQIISVDCDLKAPETAEGHGDAFFSLCLAVKAFKSYSLTMVWSPQ